MEILSANFLPNQEQLQKVKLSALWQEVCPGAFFGGRGHISCYTSPYRVMQVHAIILTASSWNYTTGCIKKN
jgi:hypothetical protein